MGTIFLHMDSLMQSFHFFEMGLFLSFGNRKLDSNFRSR